LCEWLLLTPYCSIKTFANAAHSVLQAHAAQNKDFRCGLMLLKNSSLIEA
jgi:hypothetical protein